MAKNERDNLTDDQDFFDDEDINDEDFGFILGSDGSIKHIFVPEDCVEPPPIIKEVMKALGIKELNGSFLYTLH